MQPVSKFRGTSGEVVSTYVSPMTYVSALPIALGILLLNWLCGHFGAYRIYLWLPIMSAFIAMAAMRVAIPASRGDMEPTNNVGEILAYTGRYLLLNLVWYIPWLVIWKLATKSPIRGAMDFMANPMLFFQSPVMQLLRVVLIIIAVVMPTLCLLISLFGSTTKGLFSSLSWNWLMKQRRADLAPFWSNLIGGCLVMILSALLPALILVYIGFKDSPRTGLYLAGLLNVWILSTIPLLNGRLAGVFVAHDFIQLDFITDEPLIASGGNEVNEVLPEQVVTVRSNEAKPDYDDIERRMTEIDADRLQTALADARELEASMTAPIRGQIEQMFLLLRNGDMEMARTVAATVIDAAAQRGFADISLKLFEKMGADRRKLKLSAYSLEILGNIYQSKKLLLDAAWCLHAAATAAGDAIKAQKRLFQIAELAEKSGSHKDALTLYEILIRQYPHSNLLEFAQQGAARSRTQIV
jgi:hypothetical protein